jgi:hypothetical protein
MVIEALFVLVQIVSSSQFSDRVSSRVPGSFLLLKSHTTNVVCSANIFDGLNPDPPKEKAL